MQGQVVVIGRARAVRYALRRALRDLPADLPVYRISAAGQAQEIGLLLPVYGGFVYRDVESGRATFHDSLPWFLTDMRPQGFLGRLFPGQHPDLALPERIVDWNEDQALYAAARRGEDMIGNLVVGEESFTRWSLQRPDALPEAERPRRYPELAQRTLKGETAGSSAGGEQPKFLVSIAAERGLRHVLVKFSEPLASATGRRGGDLLLCEHHAAATIAAAGHSAASTQVLEAGGRMFLESERFDRVGDRGRVGVVSIGSLDDEFVGERHDWLSSALVLERLGWIAREAVERIGWLQGFGGLIANADMHFGNLSFLYEGRRPLAVAPSYDMLPMLYAPRRGELPGLEFRPPPPPARALLQARLAQPAAREFWQRVADDRRVSADFRTAARDNGRLVATAHW